VVPDSAPLPIAWRLALLLAALAGARMSWRAPDLWPWLLFLASKLAVSVLFFGYARLGAVVIPVIALLIALAFQRLLARVPATVLAAILLVAVAADAVRVASRPTLSIDADPPDVHRDLRLDVR
jgi:hypothetical protein